MEDVDIRCKQLAFPPLIKSNRNICDLDSVNLLKLFAYLLEIYEREWTWTPTSFTKANYVPLSQKMRLLGLSHKCPKPKELKNAKQPKNGLRILSAVNDVLNKLENKYGSTQLYKKSFQHPSTRKTNKPPPPKTTNIPKNSQKPKQNQTQTQTQKTNQKETQIVPKPKPKPKTIPETAAAIAKPIAKQIRKPTATTNVLKQPSILSDIRNLDISPSLNPNENDSDGVHNTNSEPVPEEAGAVRSMSQELQHMYDAFGVAELGNSDVEKELGLELENENENKEYEQLMATTNMNDSELNDLSMSGFDQSFEGPVGDGSGMMMVDEQIESETVKFCVQIRKNVDGKSITQRFEQIQQREKNKLNKISGIKQQYSKTRRELGKLGFSAKQFQATKLVDYAEFQLRSIKQKLESMTIAQQKQPEKKSNHIDQELFKGLLGWATST